jgi:hypothetical protein
MKIRAPRAHPRRGGCSHRPFAIFFAPPYYNAAQLKLPEEAHVKDLTRKCVLVAIALLGFASAKINLSADGTAHAASAAQLNSDAQCVSTVPRSWGVYRGGSNQAGLAFEASDGTLRFVTNLPCGAVPVIALEVRRTPSGPGN